MTYEYAVAPQPGAVIQPLPAPPPPPPVAVPTPPPPPVAEWHDSRGPDYYYETYPGGPPVAAYSSVPQHPGYAPLPPRFDREGWLADCRARVRGVRSADERASIIGGLLGAVVGGVVGNRVYDAHRTAGTLIGAGVGGLAGLAIGAAIDAAGHRRSADECAAYLDRYTNGGYRGPGYAQAYGYGAPAYAYGYGYPGYGYGYYGYAYMPVLVPVPQRQVVREYVTEERVDVPVRTVTRTRVIHRRAPAPLPDKRVKIIKR
jgi:hypothetical protein